MTGIIDVCRIFQFRECRSCSICVWDAGDASTNGAATIALINGASKYFIEVVKAGGATVKVGKKSIQVDNIDKAAAVVQKLAELPDSGTSMKEKKAGTKKQATESVKLKKRK